MDHADNNDPSSHIVTIYAPIFHEKLMRLETLGQEYSGEANQLRKALKRIGYLPALALAAVLDLATIPQGKDFSEKREF